MTQIEVDLEKLKERAERCLRGQSDNVAEDAKYFAVVVRDYVTLRQQIEREKSARFLE